MKTLSGYLMIIIAIIAVWLQVIPESAQRIITTWVQSQHED